MGPRVLINETWYNTVHGVRFHDRYFGEFNGAAQVVRFQYLFANVRR